MNTVEAYSFGSIHINGKKYNSDIIIFPEKIEQNWWRNSGHNLIPDDIRKVLDFKPTDIIIGTGAFGVMKVPQSTINEIENLGINLHIEKTGKAVDTFNTLIKTDKKIVACLHLTC